MSEDQNLKLNVFYCFCGFCAINSNDIKISSIKQTNKHSWFVQGTGMIQCPECGAICRAIISDLKVQCEPFSCPTCGKKENLSFKIITIDTTRGFFAFEAEIICEKCNKKRSLKKIIDHILDIKKLKISPTGIEIEK